MELQTNYTRDDYSVIVEHGALRRLDLSVYDKAIVIIDDTVLKLHGERLQLLCSQAHIYPVAAGETLKSLSMYDQVINQIIDNGVTRQSVVIAVGGGSVGDFAGFIAATLLRGVDFIQVPTTILAHDSAIGGKVGINACGGKNLIGAFKRPKAVLYDLDFLYTLPYSEKLSGFGEIIKHAMLEGEEALLALHSDFPDRNSLKSLERIEMWLIRGMRQKLNVVQADEYEAGLRKTLNLGHTLGHAVEFHHHIPHGQAVMHGLIYATILSGRQPDFLLSWFDALELPNIKLSPFDDYHQLMIKDKKNSLEYIQFILLKEHVAVEAVSEERLRAAFQILGGYYES
ncbi:3-dehydroquinate synthase [Macrococcus hajekii]|uniref:3-dehydroquinate synthase n=1 Tax=Macrococcus hajekii TaxID=198482 RepID=A0A4V3BE77_9STAP|nr:3-dehydroquinate synthase family protein [Macrococcus hajekii]TDM02985.1 3-dehydroquinate synthase [Macrococcus hajekii]GGB05566.1 3-dehydroquinate synthase [Macrococcus hajekii]